MSGGKFHDWFEAGMTPEETLAGQARQQLKAAGDTSIEWRIAEAEVVPAIEQRLQSAGIEGINIKFYPGP